MQSTTSIQMPQAQRSTAKDYSKNPESICCQFKYFGRTVSLPERTAVFLSAALPVGLNVGLFVTSAIGALEGSAGFADAGVPGAVAGGILAGFAGYVAVRVYDMCRHTAPTTSTVQLSGIISHAPEAGNPRPV